MQYKVINNNKQNWITCIHCICSNMEIFENYIEMLSKKYNILLIDLPGHGKSINCEVTTFANVACDICKILNELKIGKTDIWAISLGCIVTKYIILNCSEKVNKIIFESPAFSIENKIYKFLFKIFNKIKIILPSSIYLRMFIYLLLLGKKRKYIRKLMYKHLKRTNRKAIDMWLMLMSKEYDNPNYECLNNGSISKKYFVGENDFVFKDCVLINITPSDSNSVVCLKGFGHLCHLEEKIEI